MRIEIVVDGGSSRGADPTWEWRTPVRERVGVRREEEEMRSPACLAKFEVEATMVAREAAAVGGGCIRWWTSG